jgi:hypothetical protein
VPIITKPSPPQLEAGDANQDLKFDQLDLVQVQIADKYLTGLPATWGEGDWNGAPGGSAGSPPTGNRLFDQLVIVAALSAGKYLTGAYAALAGIRRSTLKDPVFTGLENWLKRGGWESVRQLEFQTRRIGGCTTSGFPLHPPSTD